MYVTKKYNHKINLRTDRQRRRGEGPARAAPYTAAPTSPPGGVCSRIRLLEYVRASRYATTGRIGLGLLRDYTGRAVGRTG